MVIDNIIFEERKEIGDSLLERELEERGLVIRGDYKELVKACIKVSADFDYVDDMCFSSGVVERIGDAIMSGSNVMTDSKMVQAGIEKSLMDLWGGAVMCFAGAKDVALDAKERELPKAYVAMEKAIMLDKPSVYIIGEFPSAIMSIIRMKEEGLATPAGVIAVPSGLVNVAQTKELLMETDIPYIVSRGNKGGPAVASAIMNAILQDL